MARWIRRGAVVGAVAIVLGVVGLIFASAFLCFDSCPHDLSGAIIGQVALWLGPGLVLTGCAWVLCVRESARAGQRRWFAVLLLSLPVTVLITEVALWIADGGLLGGWLIPEFRRNVTEWKLWAFLLLLVWPVIVFLSARILGRAGASAASESSSAARQPVARGRLALGVVGALLATVLIGGVIANQGAATNLTTLRGWLEAHGTPARGQSTAHRSQLLVPGYFLSGVNSSQTIEVYEYPLAPLAAFDAARLRPSDFATDPAGASADTPLHIFSQGRLIVIYQNNDSGTLFLLTGLLGPQVAGTPTPPAPPLP